MGADTLRISIAGLGNKENGGAYQKSKEKGCRRWLAIGICMVTVKTVLSVDDGTKFRHSHCDIRH